MTLLYIWVLTRKPRGGVLLPKVFEPLLIMMIFAGFSLAVITDTLLIYFLV